MKNLIVFVLIYIIIGVVLNIIIIALPAQYITKILPTCVSGPCPVIPGSDSVTNFFSLALLWPYWFALQFLNIYHPQP